MSSKPIVAVTATTERFRDLLRIRVNDSYIRALEGAGAVPLVLPPLRDPGAADQLLGTAAGLVLTGGEDVEPVRYGADPHPALGTTNPLRDAWELALLRCARRRGMPTLAICRGAQLLNVGLGGSLIQDIPSQRPGHLPHEAERERTTRVHPVEVEPGSRLADALGTTRLQVNSVHHQGLDLVAAPLRVTARSPDGLVEGIETMEDGWWVLGVQWHPEDLIGGPEPWERSLFSAFVNRVRGEAGAERGRRKPDRRGCRQE